MAVTIRDSGTRVLYRCRSSAQGGEPESLWHALDRQRPRLTALARRLGFSPHDAEDAASETLIRAATYRELDRSRLGPFLNTVLRHYFIDQLRRSSREVEMLRLAYPVTAVEADPVEGRVVARLDAGGLLDRARLTELERLVVLLVVEGNRHTEIAARLGTTAKAVERTLGRARRKLGGARSEERVGT